MFGMCAHSAWEMAFRAHVGAAHLHSTGETQSTNRPAHGAHAVKELIHAQTWLFFPSVASTPSLFDSLPVYVSDGQSFLAGHASPPLSSVQVLSENVQPSSRATAYGAIQPSAPPPPKLPQSLDHYALLYWVSRRPDRRHRKWPSAGIGGWSGNADCFATRTSSRTVGSPCGTGGTPRRRRATVREESHCPRRGVFLLLLLL